MCSSHRITMYKGILVVGAFYEKIKKLMKKLCQKGPKIDAQIDILAIRGATFEILEHVFLKIFFIIFDARKKTRKKRKNAAQNRKKAAKIFQKSKLRRIWGRPCGMCGAAGGEEEGGASNIMRFDE